MNTPVFHGSFSFPIHLLVFHAGNVIVADCAWLAPQAMRGKRNESRFLPMIAQEIANLKRINVDYLAETTTRNAEEILKLTGAPCLDKRA